MVKVVVGLIIIVFSFGFLIKHHDQSLLDMLMSRKRKSWEEQMAAQAEESAEAPAEEQEERP